MRSGSNLCAVAAHAVLVQLANEYPKNFPLAAASFRLKEKLPPTSLQLDLVVDSARVTD